MNGRPSGESQPHIDRRDFLAAMGIVAGLAVTGVVAKTGVDAIKNREAEQPSDILGQFAQELDQLAGTDAVEHGKLPHNQAAMTEWLRGVSGVKVEAAAQNGILLETARKSGRDSTDGALDVIHSSASSLLYSPDSGPAKEKDVQDAVLPVALMTILANSDLLRGDEQPLADLLRDWAKPVLPGDDGEKLRAELTRRSVSLLTAAMTNNLDVRLNFINRDF